MGSKIVAGFRMTGAVFLILSCSGWGFFLAAQWKLHLKNLEELRKIIFLLKGEILYANSTLWEAFERIGTKSKGETGMLLERVARRLEGQQGERFFDIWKQEVHNIPKEVPLSGEDRQNLIEFGENLGYLDKEMQERTILLYLEKLDISISYLREHQQERSRLYTSLGIMGGLFLTILLY